MTDAWTPEAVLALAPDQASAKAAQELAAARQWSSLGKQGLALWGEIKGSGAKPYQSRIDLREPAFKCSCPSRKFPCKHGLALLLVHTRESKAFVDGEPPGWVADWLGGREQRAERKAEKADAAPADPKAKEKRAAEREARISDGLEQLGLWLRDLVRQGFAGTQGRTASYWEEMAARLVDAQAPGLARLVRQLESLVHSGPGWESRLLHGVSRLELLRRAYARQHELSADLAEELRSAVGWIQPQEEVLALAGIGDRWRVLGSTLVTEDRLRVRRSWLWGRGQRRPALLLDFAVGAQPMAAALPVGSEIEALLCFYPGALGLRALVKSQGAAQACADPLEGAPVEQALADYASALARVPWLERWPMTLGGVTVRVHRLEDGEHGWSLVDATGARVALPPRFAHGWHLLAASGGQALDVFGEWDGEVLLPLSIAASGTFYGVGAGMVPLRYGAAA